MTATTKQKTRKFIRWEGDRTPNEGYPALTVERTSGFNQIITDAFAQILFEGCDNTYDAVHQLELDYSKPYKKARLIAGWGSNHIWFHRISEFGEVDEKRLAIIEFDPYKI